MAADAVAVLAHCSARPTSRCSGARRNGTTGDLLARWEQHASFAGNGFVARRPGGLRIMRPDWTGVVMSGEEGDLDSEVVGYIYWQGGIGRGVQSRSYRRTWPTSPRSPTPYHPGGGMSWLTPVVREVMGDAAATDHKLAFFENAATPNLAVKLSEKLPRMISHSSSRRCGRTIAASRTHGRRSTSAAALT